MKVNFLFLVFFLTLFFSQTKWVVEKICPNGNPILEEPYGEMLSKYLVGCYYEKRIFDLNNSLLSLEKGLLENQNKLQNDLKKMYREAESEFTNIGHEVALVRAKTDKFEVDILGDGVLNFIPKSNDAIAIKKLGFWSSSGGASESHSGNIRYSFNVVSKGMVTVVLKSKISPYLFLLDRFGNVLARDDGTFGGNSKIEINLDSGKFIIVSATNEEGKSDSFSLDLKGKVDGFRKIK